MLEPISDSALRAVAMFPIPNIVLLPGALLPLHIFEPRYRAMTRDVLAGSGVLALARVKPGPAASGAVASEPIFPVVGVGRIIASSELPDGRYNILVRGSVRAEIAEEHPLEHLYRRIRARPLSDVAPAQPAVLSALHQQLIGLCDRLAEVIEQGGEQLRELVRTDDTPGGCSDLVCAALISDADERQRLLETIDPSERLACAIRHVSRLLAELDPDTASERS